MQKIFALIGGLIVVGGLLFYFLVYNKPHRSVDSADFVMDASTLIAEFDQDEEAANRKYLDYVVEVRGPVKNILADKNKSVIMLGGSQSFSSVSCTLQPAEDFAVEDLEVGDIVIVRGICAGRLLDVILVDCKVVDDE